MRISDWSSDVCSSDLLDAEVADLVARLDEGAPDIMRADDPQFERNVRFLRVADRRRNARIGNGDHQIGVDRAFDRELRADRLPDRIDRAIVGDRIGAREIDIYEAARTRRLLAERADR